MAGVINDIEALAEFRAHLMRFNHDLAENFATIQGHWRELGEVWRDDMYRLFGEALEEVTPGITQYLSATEGHEAHLAALIERLRGYFETGAGAGLGVSRPETSRGRAAGPAAGRTGVTSVHADIDALKGLHEALVRYRHAQREVAGRGEEEIKVVRASLEAKASRWRAQLEQCQAEFGACQERAAQAAAGVRPTAAADDPVDCSGYARAVEQCAERLEQIRRWQQRIDAEASEFQGTASRFGDLLENDLPRTEEHLLALIRSLEAARRVQAPGA